MARHKRRYRVGDVLEVLSPFHVYVRQAGVDWKHIRVMPTMLVDVTDKLLVTKIYEQRTFIGVSLWGKECVMVFHHAERLLEGLPHHQCVRKRFDAKSNSEAGPALAQPEAIGATRPRSSP